MITYLALVHTDAPANYGISFPDLPGCISAGDTLDEAIDNGGEAAALHLEGLLEDGLSLPNPRSIHDLRRDAEVRQLMSDAIVVPVRVQEAEAA